MRNWQILTVCILAGLPLMALAQEKPAGAASAQDCAVLAEVGKGKLDWGKTPPNTLMDAKSFGVNCDWKALGLAAPRLTQTEHPQFAFFLSRPVYAADGMHASVDYQEGGSSGPNEYFYQGFKCRVEKRAGKWAFVDCKFSFIT